MYTKNQINNFAAIFLILTLVLSAAHPSVVAAQSGDGIKRQVNAESGRISFIGPESGRVLSASRALGTFIRPQDPAMALAKRFGHEFGLANPERDLATIKSDHATDGRLITRFQQTYNGIPVMGGELIVNTNDKGDLYSMNGEVSPNISLQTQPTIDPAQAIESTLQTIAKWYQVPSDAFIVSEPELWIFDENLLRPSTRPVELVWRMEVTAEESGMPVRELVLVNAQRGGISLHFNQVDTVWNQSRNNNDNLPLVSPTCTNTIGSGSGDLYSRPYVQYDCDLYSYGVSAGDFNNDGKIDAALSVEDGVGFQHALLIFLQDNNGNLAQPVSYSAGSRTEYLATGDLNDDNRDDVVALDVFDGTISVYLQNYTGTLNNRVTYGTSATPDSIAVGDINDGGLDDVVVAHWSSATIGVFIQNGSGTLNSMISYPSVTAGYGDIAIGDINNDGLNDVIKMNGQGSSNNALVIHTQNISNTLNTYTLRTCSTPCIGRGIEVGDITGDGREDIVMAYGRNGSSAKVAVFAQDEDNNLQASISYSSHDIPDAVEIADFNSDNKLDVVALHSGWMQAGIYSLQDDGSLDTESLYSIPYKSWYYSQDVSIGDVNNDGLPDILVADGQGLVVLYRESPTPDTITVESGSNQSALLQTQFPQLLKAKVVNYLGQPISGMTVTFTAPASGASGTFADTSTNITTAITDSNGITTSSTFASNNVNGGYIVSATGVGLAGSVDFQLANGTQVRTYTTYNSTSLPGALLCTEAAPDCTSGSDLHADAAHKYAIGTYDMYQTEHGRNSIDNNNLSIISTVHYSSGYANAFWNGSQMVYGDAYGFPLADDVVAHELTHGVTQYESNLFYYYQSGAINESFSDLWGEYYDQSNGLGNDTAGVKWLMGEDVSGYGALRSMSNPPAYFDPDKMSSPHYVENESDNGGVHSNSGVNNKAVYLMVDGGTFNGKTVTVLGWEKTGAIYYEAQTNLLISGSDYSDLYYALQQACTNLIGQHGITAGNCVEVKDAVDAVEMNGQPASNFNSHAPLCDSGDPLSTIFFDDLETGMGNWSTGAIIGSNRWQYDSPYGPFAQSGQHSLYADDYPASATDAYVRTTSPISIPGKAFMHFAHAFGFEDSNGINYDGGIMEYSTNNGATWQDAGPLFLNNGYNGTIVMNQGNPLMGKTAFVKDSHGYISSRLSLQNFANQSVMFRWRMGLDPYVVDWGWWLDDIHIYTCNVPTFGDVPFSHPYYDDIEILYANGYTGGCSTSPLMFCPDVSMSRAQSAVFMLRGNFGNTYVPVTPTHFFKDNWKNSSWGEGWAESMYLEGLTAGCSPSPLKFCPDEILTNVQLAVFGLRLKHGMAYPTPTATGTVFADMTDTGFWGTGWAETAYAEGLIPSCGTDTGSGLPLFCPNALVSRGFGASVIVTAKGLTMP